MSKQATNQPGTRTDVLREERRIRARIIRDTTRGYVEQHPWSPRLMDLAMLEHWARTGVTQ